MAKGRPKKPTVIHELNGNPSRLNLDARNQKEPKPKTFRNGEYPDPPEWMADDTVSCEEWERLAPELARLGLLTVIDLSAFEMLCRAYSQWRKIDAEIKGLKSLYFQTPSGYIQQVPQVSLAGRYYKQYKDLATEFGLTPSARGRMSLPSGDNGVVDPMEALLNDTG